MIRSATKSSIVVSIMLLLTVLIQLAILIGNLLMGINEDVNYIMYIINYIVGALIIICLLLKGVAKNFLAISFFVCYMLFLMAQKPFEPHYNVFLTFTRTELNEKQYFIFSSILFLGLCVPYYTYEHFSRRERKNNSILFENNLIEVNIRSIKPILTFLLLITLPCALYMQGKIVIVRGSMAYTSGYLENVDVPAVIKAGYYIYSTVVFLYLAIKPNKRQMWFVLGTYLLIEGGLQLFQGRRALLASTLLFAIWYIIKHNKIQRINGFNKARLTIIGVGMIVLFYIVEQARDMNSTSLSMQFVRKFLVSTGGSDSVIANTIYRAKELPKNGLVYLFDPFLNNPIGNFLSGKSSVPQGMEYLRLHNSFSHWISYITDKSLYLSGHGMGSSYLAEMYLALGIPGVILSSFIVGWVIAKLNVAEFNRNIFKTAFIFFLVRRLFTLPRDGMFSWVSGLVYFGVACLLVYPFYKLSVPGKNEVLLR